jgi:hypothetical protein
MNNFGELQGKKVRIITKRGYTYICKIISWGSDFLKIRDKYDKMIFLSTSEIDIIEEVKE